MKSHTEYLTFNVPARMDFINITQPGRGDRAPERHSGRLLLCNAMHITASVFINDDEPGLHEDYKKWLEGLAPFDPRQRYRHNRTGEDNADAHISARSWGAKSSSRSRRASSTSARGSRSSTASSTAAGQAGAGQGDRGVVLVGRLDGRCVARGRATAVVHSRRALVMPARRFSIRSADPATDRGGPDFAAPRREMAVADMAVEERVGRGRQARAPSCSMTSS